MKPTSPDIPLHDIKPLVEVPDTSLYLFAAALAGALLVAALLLFLLWRYFRKEREDLRKQSLAALEAVDFSDPKAAAYAITRYGRTFAEDSERHGEVFANLTSRLETYKYKKEVGNLDDEVVGYYHNYLEMIDV